MGLLPDTQNCGLRMRRECQEPTPHNNTRRVPMDGWDMPADVSVSKLFLEWAAASGGHSPNKP